ncbi:DoxX family protein [Paraglaciecola aquimarina]|uniref:DoxX family protein n=1 Tax=Paraglaciecola algarum TaxID=3050085 RepID=A0ABS9D0S1_9ALTE|nr:DoxX family protein [Paraglaciecola sp. G1-23]MCF2946497.1 DoxX family protein [Paraglaciecola sp. G1-23]
MKVFQFYQRSHNILNKSRSFEGLAPLLIRLYLAPIMLQAGWNKYSHFNDIVDWFGNHDYGLGLPFPALMAFLAVAAELVGGALLLVGLATRWVSIPLMVTMLVAAFSVHWPNGWAAIADANSWMSNGVLMLNENVMSAPEKLDMAKNLLEKHGNYDWLTSSGKFVVLNNGIEFAITYFIMLLSLFFTGGGKHTSIDYYLANRYLNK